MKPRKAFSSQMCLMKDMSKNHLKLNTNCWTHLEEGLFQKLENAGRLSRLLGQCYSKLLFRHKHTGKCYAVKISKREMNGHEGMRDDEIQILIKFGQHPNIITVKVGPLTHA